MDEQKLFEAFGASALIGKYLRGELTDREQTELDSWIETSEENRVLFSELTNPEKLNGLLDEFYSNGANKKAVYRKLKRRLFPERRLFNLVPFHLVKRAAAAALAVAILCAAGYFMTGHDQKQTPDQKLLAAKTIIPGDGRPVMITLADGTKVLVNDSVTGLLATQAGAEIIRGADGALQYKFNDRGNKPAGMNTIETPRGRQQLLVLPDGSRVWLNALSKLQYPVAFAGDRRTVTLWGEGYFEVASDQLKPFHVQVNEWDIKVTGTQFNLNAYADEGLICATLFEGGITATANDNIVKLRPGDQFRSGFQSGKVELINDVDLPAFSSWKNGVFYMNNLDVRSLMREASRWYDIDVQYEGNAPAVRLFGELDRNTNLSELIRVLNEAGIYTVLRGRTLIIKR